MSSVLTTRLVVCEALSTTAGPIVVAREREIRAFYRELFATLAMEVDVLVSRLTGAGYHFDPSPLVGGRPVAPASTETGRALSVFEQRSKLHFAVSVRSWFETVGGVSFVGAFEEDDDLQRLVEESGDPLEVGSFDAMQPSYDSVLSEEHDSLNSGVLNLPIGRDRLHKQGLSGGPSYAVALSEQLVADATVSNLGGRPMFVRWVREMLRGGGLVRVKDGDTPPIELASLTAGLGRSWDEEVRFGF